MATDGRTPSASAPYLLTHLLEQAAEADPDHEAVRHRGVSLSYGELVVRSSRLAHALLADGVEPGERVGILMHKGLDAAVALYGIMAAGAVYVPLDPGSPASRIEFVVRDCGIRRIVTSDRMAPTLDELARSGVPLDALFGVDGGIDGAHRSIPWSSIEGFGSAPPSIATTEQDLSYILYTSGSTGTPKGIMHTHRSALSWADMTVAAYGLGPDDTLSNYAPLHFDLSTLDYFGGARGGCTTVIIPEEYTRFPASLAEMIADEGMTVFYTVPLALVRLAQPGILDGKDYSRLRLVLFGGEPMPLKHLRTVMRALPDTRFVNVYGPTETNGCTHYVVPEAPGDDTPPLPIGRPYPNVEVRVVDDAGNDVPIGESGQLLVRTPTLMKGYWGRPDLNDLAFVERDRHGGRPDLFHATGDVVSPSRDGDLRFLGRNDRQIKARGNRVELDEVEAVLLSHPSVQEAAVYAVRDMDEALQIEAAVIPVIGADVESAALRRHAGEALPPYAVPTTIEIRDDFPRTSTGKIDRRAMVAATVPDGGSHR